MNIAASTDDVGFGIDGDVRSTVVVAVGMDVAGVAVAVAVAAVGVDDDHDDVDDDGTSHYCIHPCHVPESRFTGSNAFAIRRKKRNGTQMANISIIYCRATVRAWGTLSDGIRGISARNPRDLSVL